MTARVIVGRIMWPAMSPMWAKNEPVKLGDSGPIVETHRVKVWPPNQVASTATRTRPNTAPPPAAIRPRLRERFSPMLKMIDARPAQTATMMTAARTERPGCSSQLFSLMAPNSLSSTANQNTGMAKNRKARNVAP